MKRLLQILVLAPLMACQSVNGVPTTSVPVLETPVHYELRQPQPDELLKMIDSVLLMEEQMEYHEDIATFILEREPGSLQHLIGKDFERFYMNGFPGAENLVVQDTLPWEMKSFGDLNSFSPVLRIAFLQFLNNHQGVLDDFNSLNLPNVNIRTFPVDLNENQSQKWLIGVEYESYSLQNWLLIEKRKDGLYHLLQSFDYDLAGVQDYDNEIELRDLTGDGNQEIIKIQLYYLAGGIHGGMEVYSWKTDKLSLIRSINLPGVPPIFGETAQSEYIIDDFDGDGIDDIRVDLPRFGQFDCQWTQLSIYYLDGRAQDVKIENEELPQTDECLIARALDSNDSEEQLELYREAIEKFDPTTSPSDELAWLRLHLIMTYTATGDDDQAISQFQHLISMDGEGKFLKFIKDTYSENNSPPPLTLCDSLYTSIAFQDIPDNLGSEIDADLSHWAYPIDFAPIADLICPFPSVIAKRLGKTKIPSTESPINTLMTLGYPFVWTQSLNWDGDSEQEWLGVLGFHQPMLVLMNNKEDWEIGVLEVPISSHFDFEVNTHVVADTNDLLVLLTGEGRFCDSPNTVKWLIRVSLGTMEHDSRYLCNPLRYSLSSEDDVQRTVEEFSKTSYFESFEAPDWYFKSDSKENEYERPTILGLVSEMETNVVMQNSPQETTSRINELIATLPRDDSAARLLLARLYFLRGLNYELGGKNDLAVAAYLDLIALSPESVWSQYAKIRIHPVQPNP
ncbi:MAG: hypothetical protein IT314_02700 [Anaerolineales bacterium]|nr:hypothetical protein [Anaerolineales bacterium]